MVATSAALARIDLDLKLLHLMLGDLPEIAEEWDHLGEGERVGWNLDWDQVMGALEVTLHPAYLAGSMTPSQQKRYRRILQILKQSLPIIGRLSLCPPAIPLES